jgi:hypothetical protein
LPLLPTPGKKREREGVPKERAEMGMRIEEVRKRRFGTSRVQPRRRVSYTGLGCATKTTG